MPGLALRGTGTYVFADRTTAWSVTTVDGDLEYRATDTTQHVTGTWKGKSVDTGT